MTNCDIGLLRRRDATSWVQRRTNACNRYKATQPQHCSRASPLTTSMQRYTISTRSFKSTTLRPTDNRMLFRCIVVVDVETTAETAKSAYFNRCFSAT